MSKKNKDKDSGFSERQEIRRKKHELKAEKKEFIKGVKSSDSNKAPYTERTRAYYRFAKKYPNEVNTEGFRKNRKQRPYGNTLKIILGVFLCIIAFCAGVFITKTGIEIAKTSPATATEAPVEDTSVKARLYDESAWSSSKDATVTELKNEGVNTVLIEVKQQNGTFPYALDGDSLKNAVAEITDEGFEAAAYISCLKDTAHATDYPEQAVLTTAEDNPVLYDAEGCAYLNPFSEDAVTYLTEVINSVSAAGFRYIFIDDITLPVNTGSSVPYYTGYSGKVGELNSALTNVVNKLTAAAGSGKVILVTDVYGFVSGDGVTGSRYEGTLNPAITRMRAVDVRTDNQNETGKDPSGLMPYLKTVPSAFVLDATALAVKNTDAKITLFCICSTVEDAKLAESSGIKNIIIFE